jgi:selenide,water dikinase
LQEIFPGHDYPDLVVGLGQPDDAAVFRLSDGLALVLTVDFFTPIVDTPYEFGAIAAANAVSDVYAMGGKPIAALNILGLPPQLPIPIVNTILRGGAEKIRESGAIVVGGHSVKDQELKFGFAVVGLVHPNSIVRKNKARPGDHLVLTKPIGSGVITTAIQSEKAENHHIREVIRWMMKLNGDWIPFITDESVLAATDVSGYGLLGHISEIAEQSAVGLRIISSAVPKFPGAQRYAEMGMISKGTQKNMDYFGGKIEMAKSINIEDRVILFDAQTSGGLLLCIPDRSISKLDEFSRRQNLPFWKIGNVVEGKGIILE